MFDLENAIKQWKQKMATNPAMEEGYIAELEGHLRDRVEELTGQGVTAEEAFQQGVEAMGKTEQIGGEFYKAHTVRRSGRPPWQPPRFMPALAWNYFKVAGRKISKQKGYTFINMAGLTIGMAAFLLIFLYCRFERSYDDFHRNGDRIYRIENDRISPAKVDRSAASPLGVGPALKKEFSEVVDYARIFDGSGDSNIVTRRAGPAGGTGGSERVRSFFEKRVFYADPSLLQIFSFPLLRGDAATALHAPDAVVMTESTVKKYFGDENPLNRTVAVTTALGTHDFRITGVCRDLPANSHLKFDLLLSINGLIANWPGLLTDQLWQNNAFQTYILLAPDKTPASLEAKFPGLIQAYPLRSSTFKREFHLQPLRSIHLNSRLRKEVGINGDARAVTFLEIIGFFILLIAWSNAINLATARSQQRGKEVSIRKTLGAASRQLAGQFLFESIWLNGAAFLLSLGIVWAVLPNFNRLIDRTLSLGQLGAGWIMLGLIILAGAILSGSYPAFILSSFRPALVLRGSTQGGLRGGSLRKCLVLLQFVLAVMLISATLIVARQMAFMRNRNLGVDIGRTLVLKIPQVPQARMAAAVAREQLAGLAAVADATISLSIPGRNYPASVGGFSNRGDNKKQGQNFYIFDIDKRYFPFFNIPLVSGRNFSGNPAADRSAVIINEEAARLLGFENAEQAVQQSINVIGETVQVIGVARDYHHKSLRERIEPLLFIPLLGGIFSDNFLGDVSLSLKIKGALETVMPAIDKKWRVIFPSQPLDYFFLDEEFNRQYDADRRFARVFGLASLLAIVIACLGLFGLAAFSAGRRFREIGIRKVFGASFREITVMLSWEFTRWVLLADLLAWPLAYVAMRQWQQQFAYRAPFGTGVFLLAGALSLAVAVLTVAFQAMRAARTNPVDSLKYE
jgi:putative ABC transport system permease protein